MFRYYISTFETYLKALCPYSTYESLTGTVCGRSEMRKRKESENNTINSCLDTGWDLPIIFRTITETRVTGLAGVNTGK